MNLALSTFLLIVGFVILIKGADFFVEGAAGIATRFGIPQLVIGLTIVAMGTSAPEAAVSVTAALNENAGITIGNILGSNIINILLCLSITAVITSIAVQKSTLKVEIPFMLAITLVLLGFGITGNEIVFWEGVVILILFALYLFYLFKMAKTSPEEDHDLQNKEHGEEKTVSIWKQIFFIVIGILGIVYGSDIAVENATVIAKIIGMDDRIIGLTIVAFGTSLPELVTSVTAARKGNADIAIGNIVGSNIFNILLVVGLSAVITPVAFQPGFIIDSLVSLGAGVLLYVSVMKDLTLKRKAGLVMLGAYVVYFIYIMLI